MAISGDGNDEKLVQFSAQGRENNGMAFFADLHKKLAHPVGTK
jgi:hypothetical protein